MSENLEMLNFSLTIPSLKCHLDSQCGTTVAAVQSHAEQNWQNCLGPSLSFDFDSQSLSESQLLYNLNLSKP